MPILQGFMNNIGFGSVVLMKRKCREMLFNVRGVKSGLTKSVWKSHKTLIHITFRGNCCHFEYLDQVEKSFRARKHYGKPTLNCACVVFVTKLWNIPGIIWRLIVCNFGFRLFWSTSYVIQHTFCDPHTWHQLDIVSKNYLEIIAVTLECPITLKGKYTFPVDDKDICKWINKH